MSFFQWLKKILTSSESCRHASVNRYQKYNYCPDCGKKIKLSWKIVLCSKCSLARICEVDKKGNVSPLKKFCSNCGSEEWFLKKTSNIETLETFYAVPVVETVNSINSKNSKNGKKNMGFEVWIEK